jgi:ribonuclease HI
MKPEDIVTIICYSDGGCKYNGSRDDEKPAKSYVSMKAYAVDKDGNKTMLCHIAKEPCPAETNNQAEYMALNGSIKFCSAFKTINPAIVFEFYVDSEVVVNQIKGYCTISNNKLLNLAITSKFGLSELGNANLNWIARHNIVRELGH